MVDPAQPFLLRWLPRRAEAACADVWQPQRGQAGDGVLLGLNVALQQHAALGGFHQHAARLAAPPAAMALVVKAQLRLHQAVQRDLLGCAGAQAQAGPGRDAFDFGHVQHGRQGQRPEALRQVGLVLFQGLGLYGRGFQQ